MIFDVARHKFSEALVTLMLFALASVVAAISVTEVVVIDGGAPLSGVISQFSNRHPLLTSMLMFPMLMYSGLRYARAAVRVGLYSVSSLGLLALGGVAMFACTTSANYLNLMIVVLLVSELLGRLLYCFGANMRISYLFTSMLAVGIIPLVDSSLIPFALVVPLIVIFLRGTLRESVIALVGMASPTFVYCYLVWLFGGYFDVAFVDIWGGNILEVGHEMLLSYLTIPRLIFLGVTLFLSVCSIIAYSGVRVILVDSARTIWRLLIALQIMLVATLLLVPSASPSVVVVLVLVMTQMLPQLFIRADVITTTFAYLIWVGSALATLL